MAGEQSLPTGSLDGNPFTKLYVVSYFGKGYY